ncbi:malignant fibrous histiocytoma-amplified sequence 1 homolog [Sitophilus oryzae]|uniref:Malignant fibrous histiocytoma-amplified sequence 1 homolog n=1 Tax=Sitophilus oryzae TaxID=7048 RepID=A0A6J2YSP0_SITOR|nr:malignant fibrous histiocytoma-amplified sequence 1 homolog [Sitophilus oryzae]XP_030767123.1 malignant fibrous histiocytoma-amplified sequence 1 homolog [Sitophilus oryzae]
MDKLAESKEGFNDTDENLSMQFFITLGEQYLQQYLNHDKLTYLNLSKCNLEELPEFLEIRAIQELNLSHNKLTEVPLCLYSSDLCSLKNLDLSFNKIREFNKEPSCINNIQHLRLDNNDFENIPDWFLTLRCLNLEYFNYSNNHANHYNFVINEPNLINMKLSKLELNNSCLIDKDFYWLRKFGNLQFLDIGNENNNNQKHCNKFKQIERLFIRSKWEKLEILKLSNLDLCFFPETILKFNSLKELYVANNLLSWFSNGLENLSSLEILDISGNQVVFIPDDISLLKNLKVFIACGNQIDVIPKLPPNLKVLDLYDNYLTSINNSVIESVQLLDFDYNYICLEDLDIVIFNEYCEKKTKYREIYEITDRVSCNKILDICNNSVSSSDSSFEEEHNYENDNIPNLEEDWDRENEIHLRSHVTWSDDEFDGNLYFLNANSKSKIPFLSNEDLLFVDAD